MQVVAPLSFGFVFFNLEWSFEHRPIRSNACDLPRDQPTQITAMPSSVSQVSRDGQYIAFMGWAPERLQILPFGGGKPIKSFVVPRGTRLRWTPNGKALIYPDISQGVWRQALNEERPRSVSGFEDVGMASGLVVRRQEPCLYERPDFTGDHPERELQVKRQGNKRGLNPNT